MKAWRPAAAVLPALLWACASSVPATGPSRTAAFAAPPAARASAAVPLPPKALRAAGEDTESVVNARHLLNRCAFGARPGEAERVARLGPARWLEAQLAGPEEGPLLQAALVSQRDAYAPPAKLIENWLGEGWQDQTKTLRDLRNEAEPQYRRQLQALATAELTRHILSQRQLEEVMVDFWTNHFNVFAAKGFVRLFEGDYIERALRPHALGRFADLLLATARHPAMLLYLDNADSRANVTGRDAAKRQNRGLNENYARELLELHTLGADGGYRQDDVVDVARILTGWSVLRLSGGKLEYQFKRGAHDRRAKSVLGHAFPKGEDEEEGVRLLELLAAEPATAHHLATKLCARFVADDPPPRCVEAAASAYLGSDGDIAQVLRTIVSDPTFWSASARGGKLKSPVELVASAARALDAVPDGSLALSSTLEKLGEPLLQERIPTGYPDAEDGWASGGGMLMRMSFAANLGQGDEVGLRIAWPSLLPESAPAALVARLNGLLFAGTGTPGTLSIVEQEVSAVEDVEARRAAAVALLVGSPEFQRQ